MKKYFSSFLFTLFMTGCGNNVAFEPNNLPDGYVGQKYYVPITISGGTGPVVDFNYDIHPSNSGLKLIFAEKKYHTKYIYNNFTIQGKPKTQGIITISITGGLVASAGGTFVKKYEVNVLN
ncbi:hypothetical protein [Candidatus Pantoea rara]|uniref:hypothetical protein n=1 Tax=Candidatus Pantoea rara TaxID=1947037 RepID=UPI003EB80CA5